MRPSASAFLITLKVVPPLVPACVKENERVFVDLSVPHLPGRDVLWYQLVVRVGGYDFANIDDHGWNDELIQRDLVDGDLAFHKMVRCIQVRPRVLGHGEPPGEYAIVFECREGFIEERFVARSGPMGVRRTEGVCQVYDLGPAIRQSFQNS